jgi:hypothetical protein
VYRCFRRTINGIETEGGVGEARGNEEDACWLRERETRCGMRRRVRRMGAVRLVVISEMMEVGVEAVGSVKEKDFWIPAQRRTVLIVG